MMSEEPSIWRERQAVYDRWFPTVAGTFIIAIGGLLWFVFLDQKNGPVATQSVTPSISSATGQAFVEQQIQSLEAGQVAGAATTVPASASVSGILNLKTATASELDSLPGIGAKRATTIIQLRSEGKIKSVDDLQKVQGIGTKTFAQIKDKLIWQ